MWSQYLNVTDRQTDGQTTCRSNTALCVAWRGKNLFLKWSSLPTRPPKLLHRWWASLVTVIQSRLNRVTLVAGMPLARHRLFAGRWPPMQATCRWGIASVAARDGRRQRRPWHTESFITRVTQRQIEKMPTASAPVPHLQHWPPPYTHMPCTHQHTYVAGLQCFETYISFHFTVCFFAITSSTLNRFWYFFDARNLQHSNVTSDANGFFCCELAIWRPMHLVQCRILLDQFCLSVRDEPEHCENGDR